MPENNDQLIVEKALRLSLIEVFLGSLLHNFKIPLSGHALSLNQGLFLSHYQKDAEGRFKAARQMIEVSMVVAFLKSLSPSAKKLGPMISISMQGSLYSIGLMMAGQGLLGQMLAMAFLSLWAFVQPVVSFLIIHGFDLIGAIQFFWDKLQDIIFHFGLGKEVLPAFFASLVFFKLVVAAILPIVLQKYGESLFGSYEKMLEKLILRKGIQKPAKNRAVSPVLGALKDLFRPSLLISFVLMFLFFFFNGTDTALILWKIMRSVAIAFLLFFCTRSPLIKKYLERLANLHPFSRRLYILSNKVALELQKRLS